MKRLILYPLMGISMLTSAYVTSCEARSDEQDQKGNLTIQDLVTYKANQHQILPSFAHAIITVESNYNIKARNGSSVGLGQIQCGTARNLGLEGKCSQLYDPDTNLEYAFQYLKMAIDKADGNLCHAATLYNRGLESIAKDSSYCKKVMKNIK